MNAEATDRSNWSALAWESTHVITPNHHGPPDTFDQQDRVLVLTYSLNIDWRGICPVCDAVTLGEDVVDTIKVGETITRIYASCETCGWEGLGKTAAGQH
ncbi:hypothetical protein J2W18_002441 [Rhodococcus cercidiphylli]|nr:hypothetical protein [Rhodococcus cercidiphylli]